MGTVRDEVVHQLERINATLLQNTPELVRAEFKPPELKKPLQVELSFQDGKLAKVTYVP